MENSAIYILLIFLGVLSILLVPMLIEYLKEYFDEIKFIKQEIARAEKWREVAYWKRELAATRLSIIPGISVYRAKVFRDFFGFGKRKQKGDGIFPMLMPSLLGMFVCAICLMGSTFAWYTANQSTGVVNIQAANFTVTTEVKKGDQGIEISDNGIYTLNKGEYTLKITATGSAAKGYAVIKLGTEPSDLKIATAEINQGKDVTVNLRITADSTSLQVFSKWGSGLAEGEIPPADDDISEMTVTYPETPPEENTTTQPEAEEAENPAPHNPEQSLQ